MAIFQLPSNTESSGTAIVSLVPGRTAEIARIKNIVYTSAATAHTVTVMRAVALTSADGQAASGQKVVVLSDVGAMNVVDATTVEPVAGSDYMAWLDLDGKFVFDLVASVSVSSVTMTVNFAVAIPDGSPIWLFGEVGRATNQAFSPPVSATTVLPVNAQAGIPGQFDTNVRDGVADPILIHSNNITAAGTLVSVSGEYVASNDHSMT